MKTQSEETRRKISESLKGRKRPKEVCEKISAAMKGYKKSPEHMAKLTGGKRSPETIAKMSAARTLYWRKRKEAEKNGESSI